MRSSSLTAPHPKRPAYGGDQPDAHHLEMCKEIALKAADNEGRDLLLLSHAVSGGLRQADDVGDGYQAVVRFDRDYQAQARAGFCSVHI